MAIQIKVPTLGESVSEATIAKWHKAPGDTVQVDDLLVELETDKVTLEVNAPESGVLQSIAFAEGSTVEVDAVLGAIDENATTKGVSSTSNVSNAPKANAASLQANSSEKISSPAATKIISEKGLDANKIEGTGKGGRITKEDAVNTSLSALTTPLSTAQNSPKSVRPAHPREERIKMSRLRKTIAQRLKDSQNTAAILSTFNEIDMSGIFRIRKTYQEQFVKMHGCKLGFMSFFTKAVVEALKEIPAVNAEIDGDDIIYKNYYDIGVAVGTEQGLVVPILRDADLLSFAEIEKEITALAKKAREGKLTMQEMTGGTFSITNGGTYGSLLSTPIINPPQSGILGMHNIVERPVAINGQVEIRPMMYVALSYDHRIIDGKDAVTFLVRIKELVENPERLLLAI